MAKRDRGASLSETADEGDSMSQAQVGDLVEIHGHRLGQPGRTGEILEVLGEPGHEHYRVRWEDGRESIFTPGSDASIKHTRRAKKKPAPLHES